MGSMAVNGENGHKSLTDYAANKNNGVDCTSVAARGNYPVCDENYGYNVLRCSDEVRLTHTLPSPASRHRRRFPRRRNSTMQRSQYFEHSRLLLVPFRSGESG